jgi:hypothetical protein
VVGLVLKAFGGLVIKDLSGRSISSAGQVGERVDGFTVEK